MQVVRVNPSTPRSGYAPRLLTITLSLTNNTNRVIRNLSITADRGTPLSKQLELNTSLAGVGVTGSGLPVPAIHPVSVNLSPGATGQRVLYRIRTSVSDKVVGLGLCLCADAIYPITLSARTTAAGATKTVATAHTYIPSFDQSHSQVQVSWVWPLIDRPHRIGDGSAFIDDDLALEVAPDGRLDRALRVVERVGPSVPITVVVDPEMLDELEIMSTGKYTVRTSATTVSPGIGQTVANQWLARLRAVLADPEVTLDLTPYADPDVQALASQGLSWSSTMPRAMATRVATALGTKPVASTVSWPAGGAVDQAALDAIAESGAKTVILNRASIAPKEVDDIPASLARLHTTAGSMTAALTSPAIQAYVRSIVTVGGAADSSLPQLVSEIAVRVDPEKQRKLGHVVVLTAPRYVNPAVGPAVRAILQTTSQSTFSEGVALDEAATGNLVPKLVSHLRAVPVTADPLPDEIVGQASYVASSLGPVTAMLSKSQPARSTVTALPWQLQQSESAGWRSDADSIGGPAVGERLITGLRRQVETIIKSVQILKQSSSSGSYTLASKKALLPLTVQNTSRYALLVNIDIRAQKGIPGFNTYSGSALIQPDRKQTVKVPVEVTRSGRIPISVQLSTPTIRGAPGKRLGEAITLNVHSTALGTIGVVITIVAGVVLVLALLIRYIRRIKRIRTKRRKKHSGSTSTSSILPEPAS